MKHSVDRILTTHAGSLPRPSELIDLVKNGDSNAMEQATNAEQLRSAVGEIVRSEKIAGETPDERQVDRDVAQFLRAERRLAERNRELVAKTLERTLRDGTLIFRGKPTPAREAGATLQAAAQVVLGQAATEVFQHYHLVPIRPATDAARA